MNHVKKQPTSNNQHPTSKDGGWRRHWLFDFGCWLLVVSRFRLGVGILLALLAGGTFATAQTNKNIPGPADYAAFSQFVTDRNIFDPSRQPHFSGSTARTRTRTRTRTSSSAPAFTLVGTMSYEKGMFAFFSGTDAELKQVLPVSGKIAVYTVTAIAPGRVRLESADKKQTLELKVGDVVRQENGGWQSAGAGEPGAVATENSDDSGAASAPASASAPNDILKRLMEKREQENK